MITAREDVSRDHVPARQLFPSSVVQQGRTQLRTVISHRSCNQSFQADEDYFRATVLPFSEGTPGARALLDDHRRVRVERPTVAQQWESRITNVTPNGLLLPAGTFGMTVDDRRLNRVIWKVVRGLVYLDSGALLRSEPSRSIRLLTGEGFEEHRGTYGLVPLDRTVVMPGVFEFGRHSVTRDRATLTTFMLVFLDSAVALVVYDESVCAYRGAEDGAGTTASPQAPPAPS